MSEQTKCAGINFEDEIRRYIGETVTIFTTSGGDSGQGFTGVVLSVNRTYVKLITQIGTAPGWPLSSECGRCDDYSRESTGDRFRVGSVTNIPVNRISAFVRNAV